MARMDQTFTRSSALMGLSFVAAVILGLVFYSFSLFQSLKSEVISLLGEVSSQSVVILQKEIGEHQRGLQDLAVLFGQQEFFDARRAAAELLAISESNDYKRMGVAGPDGAAYTTDHARLNIADRAYFKQCMSGSAAVSDTITDRVDNEKINVYSAPIYHGGKVAGVLFATSRTEIYQSAIEVKTFDGTGYSYIVKQNGDMVIASSNPASVRDIGNLFDYLAGVTPSGNEKMVEKLRAQMQNGGSGCITLADSGVEKYLDYRPVGINDWYLLTVVPASVVNEKMNFTMWWTYALCVSIIVLFAAFLMFVLRQQAKNRAILEQIAYVDPLTGGSTYEKFRLDACMILHKVRPPYCAAIVLDIDKFKYINDTFGYELGDSMIRSIWGVLSGTLRPGELAARKSADHFACLLLYNGTEALCRRVEELCAKLKAHRSAGDSVFELIPSLGVYEVAGNETDFDQIFDKAEMARKTIKGQHTLLYAFYDECLHQKLLREKEIENQMEDALTNQDFFVVYQPKYSVKTGRIVGSEALVRWNYTGKTILSPNEYIPLFESNGLILMLDEYVFEQVCIKMREWLARGLPMLPVSVNMSQLHLYNSNFLDSYQAILQKYGLDCGMIQLELTESALFDNADTFSEVIESLRKSGFTILMDDFGTGYSSLKLLKRIPVDILKLDKSFADDIGDEKANRIIASIIKLAQSLHMKVIAEGVETEEQYQFLRDVSCDEIQGYYFSRPVTVEEYEGMLYEASREAPVP